MYDELEVSNELQINKLSEENTEEVTSQSTITIQDLDIINNNIVSGYLYVTGALGIVSGLLLGIAFHGIFRSK